MRLQLQGLKPDPCSQTIGLNVTSGQRPFTVSLWCPTTGRLASLCVVVKSDRKEEPEWPAAPALGLLQAGSQRALL